MLIDILREVRNSFWDGWKSTGEFVSVEGIIELPGIFAPGNYVLLKSPTNISVYMLHNYPEEQKFLLEDTINQTFNSVFRLQIPEDFIRLSKEIEEFRRNTPNSAIVSEQFGEYRYTLGKTNESWELVFKKSLDRYRKMSDPLLGHR